MSQFIKEKWPYLLAGGVVAASAVGYLVYRKQKAGSSTAVDVKTGSGGGGGGGGAASAPIKLTAEQFAELKAAVEQYIAYDPNPIHKATVEVIWGLKTDAGYEQLYKAFIPRISFGTAGLRSKMSFGYSNMNDLVVLQTSQGLARYAEQQFGSKKAHEMGIVIGYDGRYNSARFADINACKFVSQGFNVYLVSELAMTPIVPYAVLQYGAAVGVMVTASHNPKNDNGYKVYWANGAQIIPPHDAGIAASIMANLKPWGTDPAKDLKLSAQPNGKALVKDAMEMADRYFSQVTKLYKWNPYVLVTDIITSSHHHISNARRLYCDHVWMM